MTTRPLRGALLTAPAVLIAAAILAGCQPAPKLVDGCYYLGNRPVMRLAGDRGRLLVPGKVRDFRAAVQGDRVQVTPGFLFDSAGAGDFHSVAWDAPQHLEIKPGTAKPTLVAHYVAYGDAELVLGKPCPLAM